jgi:hypothetical protein
MGDVPLIDADRFLQCGRPANIPGTPKYSLRLFPIWERAI